MSLNRKWLGPAGLCLLAWASPTLHAQPKPHTPAERAAEALREHALRSSAFKKQAAQLFQIHNEGDKDCTVTFISLGGVANIVAYNLEAHLYKPNGTITAKQPITLKPMTSLVLEFASGDCKAIVEVDPKTPPGPMVINIYGNDSKDAKRFFWKFQKEGDAAKFEPTNLFFPSDDPKALGGFEPYIGLSEALKLDWN
jgi:hypothetical protein